MKPARGRPKKVPEEKTSPLAIRVTDEDREAIRRLADEAGLSVSAFVAATLRAHLDSGG